VVRDGEEVLELNCVEMVCVSQWKSVNLKIVQAS